SIVRSHVFLVRRDLAAIALDREPGAADVMAVRLARGGVLRVPVDRPATDRDLLGPVGAPGLADQFRVYAADLGRTVGRQRRPRHRAVTGAVRDVLYLVVLGEQVQRHAVLVG